MDNPWHLLWSVRSSDERMKPSPLDGSLILTSTSFSPSKYDFRQATAELIFLDHKWTGMFMGNKFLFVAASSWQLCFHTRENKTVFCTPAISNSIARCLNVNIYWAVTFLQQIHQDLLCNRGLRFSSSCWLFKASFSTEKYLPLLEISLLMFFIWALFKSRYCKSGNRVSVFARSSTLTLLHVSTHN